MDLIQGRLHAVDHGRLRGDQQRFDPGITAVRPWWPQLVIAEQADHQSLALLLVVLGDAGAGQARSIRQICRVGTEGWCRPQLLLGQGASGQNQHGEPGIVAVQGCMLRSL